ncbi:MAG: ABC transporter substrate-binding protein, partial [Alphaproteobacteria bacterium]
YRRAWTEFDLKRANALLDEIGLTRRDGAVRLLPDGRPMNIIVETAGEDTEQTDILELIHDSWLRAGIKLYTRPSQREVFRNRIFAGETMVSVWTGYENGLPNENTSPNEFAPTTQLQLQWPKWGQHFETGGAVGEAPQLPAAKELIGLFGQWKRTSNAGSRREIWHRMLKIHADNVFSIGVVGAVPQPVVMTNRLRNVPKEGIYNWNPGAHFGVYRPDTFWFSDAGSPSPRKKN